MSSTLCIAHTKEDRSRFVEPFSVALQRVGVVPVCDEWLLNGRDSLIDRIFREGLKGTSALVVVLSRFNARHEWTHYEIEESVVDRIKGISQFAVVLLDGRATPDGLKPDIPVFSVQNPGDLIELNSLLQQLGPLLMQRPAPAEQDSENDGPDFHVPGLDSIDTMLLALACRCAIENNSLLVKVEDVEVLAEPLQLDTESFRRSLESIVSRSHVTAKRANGGQIAVVEIARSSFGLYMNHVLDDFDDIVSDLAVSIVGGIRDNESLVERSHLPPLVVTYSVLDELDAKGQITVIRQMKGNRRIKRISPEFQQMYAGI